MAGVAVLPPGKSLFSPSQPRVKHHHHHHNHPPNNNRSPNRPMPNGRKRRPSKSPPSRASMTPDAPPMAASLVQGQVKILKRGEQLPIPKETFTTTNPDTHPGSVKNQPVSAQESVPTLTHVANPSLSGGFYASISSPPASSVPYPDFILKGMRVVGVEVDEATSALRRILGLTNL